MLSLGPQHSFPLEEVFDYLHPQTAREVLVQALLAAPMFATRWRWNAQRSLLLERARNGKRVPAAILRMRAEDLLARAFPQVLACPETLPGGPLPVPDDHPIVRQTVEDCLTEAMDVDGFLEVLRGLRDGSIERRAIDTPEPSAFARGILTSPPYTFLDDAPLEERRTRAVLTRRILDPRTADELGALDADAVARVRDEAWPRPENAEEVHEALLWMGYVAAAEAGPWQAWLDELAAARRVVRDGDRYFAVEASREPKAVLRGRLEALGPIFVEPGSDDEALLLQLEAEGVVLRARIDGRSAWCDRRLLARIQRYTLDRLRREIEPVTAAQFLRFLCCWQHVDPTIASKARGASPSGRAARRLRGAGRGVGGQRAPGAGPRLQARLARPAVAQRASRLGPLLGSSAIAGAADAGRARAARAARDLGALAAATVRPAPGPTAEEVLGVLRARGAVFVQELVARAGCRSPGRGGAGRARGAGSGHLRLLRRHALAAASRVAPARRRRVERPLEPARSRWGAGRERRARRVRGAPLLRRTGVVFRRTTRASASRCRGATSRARAALLEARGEIRGGRFVAGFDGEQYALPEAVTLLRSLRRKPARPLGGDRFQLSSADPLDFRGVLTPGPVAAPTTLLGAREAATAIGG